jgi:hypothetical protein
MVIDEKKVKYNFNSAREQTKPIRSRGGSEISNEELEVYTTVNGMTALCYILVSPKIFVVKLCLTVNCLAYE